MWFITTLFCILLACAAAIDPSADVEYFGRFVFENDTQKADWPGSGIKVHLVTTNIITSVALSFKNCNGSCNFYVQVDLNCAEYMRFEISSKNKVAQFDLYQPVIGTAFEIAFTKITEVSCADAGGVMELDDLEIYGAGMIPKDKFQKLYKSCSSGYSMLVFGDSVSVAYGVDGTYPCTYSASTQNIEDGYAALVAKAIGAQLHVIGWSGKGVVRNYGDSSQTSVDPLPTLYNRTLGSLSASGDSSNSNYWSPSLYQPDVVLVLLGSNDYSTQPNPTDEQFITGLVNFLSALRVEYPSAKIAAMCSPSAHGPQCANIETATESVVGGDVSYLFLDPSLYDGGYGCDYHPNRQSQQNMADVVTPFVKSLLGI